MRSVVRGEENESIFCDLKLPEQVENPSNVLVHTRDHGGLSLVLLGPIHLVVNSVFGDFGPVPKHPAAFVVGVGNGEG